MLLRGEASPLEQLKLEAEFRIHVGFILLEMKSLDIDPCPGVGAAQGVLGSFPGLAQSAQDLWHWGGSGGAGLGVQQELGCAMLGFMPGSHFG